MNPKTYFKAVVIFVLLGLASAGGCLGGLGQRPRCGQIFDLIPGVDQVANALVASPCDILVCNLDVTCQRTCNSPLLTSISFFLTSLTNSLVCDGCLVPCPDNLAIEKCLNRDGRQSLLGFGK